MSSKYDDKLKRFEKESKASRLRINKMFCENDPTRTERFFEARNKVLLRLSMINHKIDRCNREIDVFEEQKKPLLKEQKKLVYDYNNFLDGVGCVEWGLKK